MKKVLVFLLIVFLTFIIYKVNDNNLIDYMSLGDSINQGINSYGNKTFGYNDYIKSYLENNDLLHRYNSYYSKNSYTIQELLDDIKDNKEILYNDNTYNIRKELREADLVTLAIGMDELVKILDDEELSFLSLKPKLDTMINNMNDLLNSLTSLAKCKIVLVGYYNPYNKTNKEINEIFAYINDKYSNLAKKYKITYIDIYNLIKDKGYLPNENSYHLTSQGYLKIANEVINKIEKDI